MDFLFASPHRHYFAHITDTTPPLLLSEFPETIRDLAILMGFRITQQRFN